MTNVHVYKKYKEQAISLRKQGKTYSEILAEIPVAKSTISLWLQEVHLAKKQKQQITEKKRLAALRGAFSRKTDRIERTKIIHEASRKEISKLSRRELWLIGIALYWAEGSKSKEYNPSVGIDFTNSDYKMIQIFIHWLKLCCNIKDDELGYEIYIHESCRNKIQEVIKFWSNKIGVPEHFLQRVRYKKNKIRTKRHNTKDLYNGCFRVRVKESSILNRRIIGWIEGIMKNL